jgi:hypothetical protein
VRKNRHSQFIAFRAGDRLLGALHERASLAEVSTSEFLRSVVGERCGLQHQEERA